MPNSRKKAGREENGTAVKCQKASVGIVNILRSRRGSQMVEATMVLPLTILIMAALIGLMMTFFIRLTDQVEVNAQERQKLYEKEETGIIRLHDRIRDAGEEVVQG